MVKSLFKRNKKGAIEDFITIIVILFTFSLVVLIIFKFYNEFNTNIQANDDIPTASKTASNQINGLYTNVIDNSFLIMIVGLSIGAFILAALVRIHPIFYVFFILIWLIIILLAGVFSNVYQTMAANPDMVDVANQLTFINFIMGRLPFIIGILGSLLAIIQYKTYKVNLE